MAEIYGREDGICEGLRRLDAPDRRRPRLPRHLGDRRPGHPPRRRRGLGARRSAGRARSCSRSSATGRRSRARSTRRSTSPRSGSCPIVFVMENNNYKSYTRVEQEDANAAAGEPLAVKAKAYQHARRDGGRRRPAGGLRDGRERRSSARARARGRRSSSRSSTASAPTATSSPRPACRCTTPSTRRSPSSATWRSTRRRSAATRCRASARSSSTDGTLARRGGRRDRRGGARRDAGGRRVRAREPVPGGRDGHRLRLRLRRIDRWHASFPTSPRSARRSTRRWSATTRSSTSARTSPRTDDDPYVKAFGSDRVRVTPISETAEIGMAVGAAFAGYRPVVELYMAEFMLVAMDQVVNEATRFHYMTAGQVKVPLVLKAGYGFTAGWAGQHTGTIYGMFMGVPGLKVVVPSTAADAKGLMTAVDPRRQPGRPLPQLPADARARRRPRGRARRSDRRGGGAAARAATSRSSAIGWMRRQGARGGRAARRRGRPGRGDRPADARTARHGDDPAVGREDRQARDRRPGDAARVGGGGDRGGGRRRRASRR